MKELIYRELHLARKSLGTCLLVYLLFAILTDLFALSTQVGNLAKYLSEEKLVSFVQMIPTAALFGYLILLVTAPEAMMQTMSSDFKTAWLKYALSSPRSVKEWVGAKYLTYLLMTSLAMLLGGVHVIISCALSGRSVPGGTLYLYFFCALLVMTVSSLLMPIGFYTQNMDFVNYIFLIPIMLGLWGFYGLAALYFKNNKGKDLYDFLEYISGRVRLFSGSMLEIILKVCMPIVFVLVIAGSFLVSVRFLDGRRMVKGGQKAHGEGQDKRRLLKGGKGGKK